MTPGGTWWGRVVVAVLVAGIGFLVVAQFRTGRDSPLDVASEADLTRILATLTQEANALRAEVETLTSDIAALEDAGRAASEAARAVGAERRALAVLSGTVPVEGPGVRISVEDPFERVRARDLLDAVQELRDAGAEALAVGALRVVASTSFVDRPDGTLAVDGVTLRAPFSLTAIGDPATLEGGVRIPGGLVDTLAGRDGVIVEVTREPLIRLPAVAS